MKSVAPEIILQWGTCCRMCLIIKSPHTHTEHENINKFLNIYKSFYSKKAGEAESCQQNRGFFFLCSLSREDNTKFFLKAVVFKKASSVGAGGAGLLDRRHLY